MNNRYEITKVANGFLVRLSPGFNSDRVSMTSDAEIHVFKTFGQAAWWLDKRFKSVK